MNTQIFETATPATEEPIATPQVPQNFLSVEARAPALIIVPSRDDDHAPRILESRRRRARRRAGRH